MKFPIPLSDFRTKITLLTASVTVDNELNRIIGKVPNKEVWAAVEVKSAAVDNTAAGVRPELHYKFYIRKQDIRCDFVRYKGKVLTLTAPWYVVGNYICIEAVENPWQQLV